MARGEAPVTTGDGVEKFCTGKVIDAARFESTDNLTSGHKLVKKLYLDRFWLVDAASVQLHGLLRK